MKCWQFISESLSVKELVITVLSFLNSTTFLIVKGILLYMLSIYIISYSFNYSVDVTSCILP